MPQRRLMPDVVKDQDLACVQPTTTVRTAVRVMAERGVSALLVTEGRMLKGIFTERDLAARVVAADLDPDETPVSAAMTADPASLAPDAAAVDALRLMERRGCRHLPIVTSDGVALGLVSIRDLYAVVRASLENEISNCEAFIHGDAYSMSASTPKTM